MEHTSPYRFQRIAPGVSAGCINNLPILDMATVVEAPPTQSTPPNWRITGILAAVPFIATLVSTAQGPGLSPDSVNYLSTGLNLAGGQGLTTYSGETLTVFPPGLPAVIAAGELLGLGADWTVRLLNAVSFSAIVVLGAVLLARHIADLRLIIGATAFIAVSVALLAVSSMAWTEAPFIVVTLAFILLLERTLAEPARWRWVAVCALLVWVAFVLRYAGVSLVAVGGATLLVGLWRGNRVVAVRNAVAFGVLAVVGPLAWMLRNRSIDETLMGPRYPSTDTPAQVGYRIVRTVSEWLAPVPVPGPLLGLIGIGLLGGLVGSIIVVWRRRGAEQPNPFPVSLLPTAVFGLGYTAYLALAQLTTAFDPINSRLLSPIFIPLVVAVTVAIDRMAVLTPGRLRRATAVVLIGVVAVQGASFAIDTVRWGTDGKGFATLKWQESELAAAAAKLPDQASVYSNRSVGLWAATGRAPLLDAPRATAYRSSQETPVPGAFIEAADCGETYLAWFTESAKKAGPPEELTEVVTLTPVSEFDDGTLYRLGPLGEPDCDSGTTG